MLIKFILFILIFTKLTASNNILEKNYYVDSNDINISSIIKNIQTDKNLFKIPSNKSLKRIKTTMLIKILKENGYDNVKKSSNYITFHKKSTIDKTHIINEIKRYYKQKYDIIYIESITVNPRGYIKKLPTEYSVKIKKRNFLFNKGILSIKTKANKQLFFEYTINAKLPVYMAVEKLKKDTQVSSFNTKRNIIILNKLRAKPIQHIVKNSLQTKYQLSKNKILTTQNTKKLDVIKRGSTISVILHSEGINISFIAKALENAKMGDTLTVKNTNNKKLKVKAIGKNKAEMW